MATDAQIKEFINLFGTLALAECNRRIAAGKPFILPSVCMAQSALESDWGQAGIMKKANAFFGIKAGGSWTGKIYTADTWEVKDGEAYNTVANFRAYDSPAESMADYYSLTTEASRYSKALSYGADQSKWLTPRETVTALHAAGYATDELYVSKIMNTLNGRSLDDWDKLITGIDDGSGYTGAYYSFKAADLQQGTIDNAAIQNRVTLKPEKALTVTADTTFTLSLPSGYNIYFRRELNEDIIVDNNVYANGDKVTFAAGEVVTFTLKRADDSVLKVEDVTETIIFTNEALPAGDLKPGGAIAYFVKIE